MYSDAKSGVVEQTPMPDHVPRVPEVGATSAALKSAAFFIAAKCQPYNEDFMMCRKEKWNTHGPAGCLKEGRKVTRCAISVIEQLNKVCGDAYKTHYECLDNHNQQYKDCRPAERGLNACAFMKLGLVKVVPGTPEGQTPMWLEPNPFYGPKDQSQDLAGREMEMKYTGMNISRYDKLPFESAKAKQETERQSALRSLKEKVFSEGSSSQDKS